MTPLGRPETTTHFADDATLAYIARLERELTALRSITNTSTGAGQERRTQGAEIDAGPASAPTTSEALMSAVAIVRGERAAWAKGVGDDSAIMACDSILDSLLPMLAASNPPAEQSEKEGKP